jgi:hypothetical protein
MTIKQAAFLISRVISLWFFYQALLALIQVPATFALMSSVASMKNMPAMDEYSYRVFAASAALALQGCVEVVLAIMFYRFGPWVAGFLMGAKEEVVGE